MKRAHHEFLVFAQFLRRVRIDQDGGFREYLFFQLVRPEHHVDGILDANILDEDRGLHLGPHIAVEHEADAGGARNGFQRQFQRRVAEFEIDRILHATLERRRSQRTAPLPLAHIVVQAQRGGMRRVFSQHALDQQIGGQRIALGQLLARFDDQRLLAARGDNRIQAGAGARVGRLDGKHFAVHLVGGIEAAGVRLGGCGHQHATENIVTLQEILDARFRVVGLLLHRQFQPRQAFAPAALLDQFVGLLRRTGATAEGDGERERGEDKK